MRPGSASRSRPSYRYAEELGLDVEPGRVQLFRTMAGSFAAFEHEVTVHTLGVEFPAVVFFAQD